MPSDSTVVATRSIVVTASIGYWPEALSADSITASAPSNTAVATITTGGLATGAGTGSTTIQATSGSISGSTGLTVTAPVLVSIAVTPANPTRNLKGHGKAPTTYS